MPLEPFALYNFYHLHPASPLTLAITPNQPSLHKMAPIARIIFSHPRADCEAIEFGPEDHTGALIASKLPFTVTSREGRLYSYSHQALWNQDVSFQIFRHRTGGWENLRYKVSECPEGVRFKHYTPKDVESSGLEESKGETKTEVEDVELNGGEGVWLKGKGGSQI